MSRVYRKPKGRDVYEDGKERATIGVWMRLTREEVAAAEKMAEKKELSLPQFLRRIGEDALRRKISTAQQSN